MKITIQDIQNKKNSGEKITMLTAYDYPMARAVDQAGVDIVLVGDSVANVVLGLESTLEVGMTEMIHHAKAVRRGVENALLVGDMPYESYQRQGSEPWVQAKRFVDEAGCDAVKLEWFDDCLAVTEAIVQASIPVMGHVGLTPQTADKLGGFKVQGKDAESAQLILERAQALEKAGCFSIVLECVPKDLAKKISETLKIPTFGIGAGIHCDGQVLVTHDLLGLFDRYTPKFVKQYAQLNDVAATAIGQYIKEVQSGAFPDDKHSFK
jgi:3-methyl-2-oxobutanoate hydroxymethyltransferase